MYVRLVHGQCCENNTYKPIHTRITTGTMTQRACPSLQVTDTQEYKSSMYVPAWAERVLLCVFLGQIYILEEGQFFFYWHDTSYTHTVECNEWHSVNILCVCLCVCVRVCTSVHCGLPHRCRPRSIYGCESCMRTLRLVSIALLHPLSLLSQPPEYARHQCTQHLNLITHSTDQLFQFFIWDN